MPPPGGLLMMPCASGPGGVDDDLGRALDFAGLAMSIPLIAKAAREDFNALGSSNGSGF